MSFSFLFFSFFLFLDDNTTFTSSMSSSRPDADSMRPAKESKGGEVGERRWRRIQWSGLTDGGFPNPSMRSYGKLRRRRSQLSAFCLLSNPTRRGGNKKKRRKGANVWMGCEAGVGIQMGSAEVTFLISPSISSMHPLFYHSPPPHTCTTYSVQSSTHSVYSNPLEPPPRGKGSGGVPSKHVPSPTYFALPSCFVRVSNKTDGQEKKMEKRGKKRVSISLQSSTWATFID